MLPRLPLLLLTGLLSVLAQAAPLPEPGAKPAPPEDLPSAIQRQTADLQALQGKAADAAAALRKWYETALDAVKKDALAKGNLDGVLAVDAERERMERDLTAEEKSQLPPLSQTVRTQYDQARANQAAQLKTTLTSSLLAYLTTLEDLEKRLTKKGDLDAAIATRQERTAAKDRFLASPEGAATPAPPAPVVQAPPAPAPAPVATLAKPSGPGVITVAAELKAKGKIKDPGPGAIPFVAPDGNGRRGANGVLLRNPSATGANGSTWSFGYMRGGSAQLIQIIHPRHEGQVLVSLKTTGVEIATPLSWKDVNWRGLGDPKKVKMTSASAKVFPLKDDVHYDVISTLSPTGSYALSIDGTVVATGHVTTTSPILLGEGFTGDGLPGKLAAGSAALIVGPRDSGINDCHDIKFQPSAPEPSH